MLWHVRLCNLFLIVMLGASVIAAFGNGAHETHVQETLLSSSWQHWLGTDALGRDLLLRVLEGARITIIMALLCSVLAFVIGVTYGSVAAMVGGWLDQIMMRVMEVFSSMPQMVVIGLVVLLMFPKDSAVTGAVGILKLSLAIALSAWPMFARMTRNLLAREKSLLYVEAAVAIGARWPRILFFEIFPNLKPAFLVLIGLQLPNFILFESFLSFFGLGLQAPIASWGVLLQEGWRTMSVYPHLLFYPAGFLFATILSINLVFDHWRARFMGFIPQMESNH